MPGQRRSVVYEKRGRWACATFDIWVNGQYLILFCLQNAMLELNRTNRLLS
jgi:plasmid maintenance system killer protein